MATATLHLPGEETVRRSALILGAPGSGKTRLAGTWPHPLFVDLENGAASATSGGATRIVVATEKSTLTTVRNIIDRVKKGAFSKGLTTFEYDSKMLKIGTVVIDPLDVVQQACKQFDVLKGSRSKMEWDDWDTILNLMLPLILDLNSLPVHTVVISHVKRKEGKKTKRGDNLPGFMEAAMQGSLRSQLPGWFDVVLHILVNDEGERGVLISPRTHQGYRILAK
ncbi:unnamed protein product, partial [marine sediment metagenome]